MASKQSLVLRVTFNNKLRLKNLPSLVSIIPVKQAATSITMNLYVFNNIASPKTCMKLQRNAWQFFRLDISFPVSEKYWKWDGWNGRREEKNGSLH